MTINLRIGKLILIKFAFMCFCPFITLESHFTSYAILQVLGNVLLS